MGQRVSQSAKAKDEGHEGLNAPQTVQPEKQWDPDRKRVHLQGGHPNSGGVATPRKGRRRLPAFRSCRSRGLQKQRGDFPPLHNQSPQTRCLALSSRCCRPALCSGSLRPPLGWNSGPPSTLLHTSGKSWLPAVTGLRSSLLSLLQVASCLFYGLIS